MAKVDDYTAFVLKVLDAIESDPAIVTVCRISGVTHRRGGEQSASYVAPLEESFIVKFWFSETAGCGESVTEPTLDRAVARAIERIASLKAWAKSRAEQNRAGGLPG